MPKNNSLNYVHMNMVMEFKEQLKDHQAEASDETTRQGKLIFLEHNMEDFYRWFTGTYAFRRNGNMAEYERLIDEKYSQIKNPTAKPDADYNSRQLPAPCPDCGGLLFVRTRRMRVRGQDDRLDYFVGCANFETRGCRHSEALTDQIKAAIDATPHEEVDF